MTRQNKIAKILDLNKSLVYGQTLISTKTSMENPLKRAFKKYPRFYQMVRRIVSPTLFLRGQSSAFFIRNVSYEKIIINVGSGNRRIREDVINVDMLSYEDVDVCARAEDLPFKDESVDYLIAETLLEHVKDPVGVVNEFWRVLKVNGVVFMTIPFLYPFHAVPEDYTRFTANGVQELLRDFDVKRLEIYAGPVSTLIWSLAYFCALPISYLGRGVFEYTAYLLMVILSPLKILDMVIRKFPGATFIATGFLFVGVKRG